MRIPDPVGFDQVRTTHGETVSVSILIAALVGMLGGGPIIIDHHDWIAALRRANNKKITIKTEKDPFRVILELKE